jgi:hypothetical protein
MRIRYIPLSGVFFFASLLLAHCILASNPILFAQTGMPGPVSKLGIKITFPKTNSTVPVGPLVVNGTSTDTSQTDCQVHIDWNDLKPMQNVTAAGTNGTNDYSKWTFTFSQNYHLIVEGTNELTSKIVCLDDSLGNITTKFYSINVTGINTNITSNSSSVPARANQTNYESDGFKSVTYHGVLPQYKGDSNTKSGIYYGKENDHSEKQDANPATTVTSDDHESATTNLAAVEAGGPKPSGAIDASNTPKEDSVRPSEIAPEVGNSKAKNVELKIDEVNSTGADIARISKGTEIGKTAEVGNIVDLSDDGYAAIAHKSDKTKEKSTVENGSTDVTHGTELHPSEVNTPEVDVGEVNKDANASDDTNLAHQSDVNFDEVHIADSNALDATELDTSVPIANTDVGSFIDNTPSKDIQVEGETSFSDKGDTTKALSDFHNNVKDTIQEGIIDDGKVSDTQPVKLKAMDKDSANKDKKSDAKDLKSMKPKKIQKKKIPIPEFYHKDPFYAHIN